MLAKLEMAKAELRIKYLLGPLALVYDVCVCRLGHTLPYGDAGT